MFHHKHRIADVSQIFKRINQSFIITLVQTYAGEPEIWHADLYRLSHPDEVMELGLDAAMEDAVCLIEWPDRAGPGRWNDALRLVLAARPDGARSLTAMVPQSWEGRWPFP